VAAGVGGALARGVAARDGMLFTTMPLMRGVPGGRYDGVVADMGVDGIAKLPPTEGDTPTPGVSGPFAFWSLRASF
jgi:hypothetical protein